MSKKSRKKSKTAGKVAPGTPPGTPGDGSGPANRGEHAMQPDTAHADHHPDPLDGTAAVVPVTDAMMDHAAHGAAVLADGVAHGTVALDEAAHRGAVPPEQAPAAAGDMAEALTDTAAAASDDAVRLADAAAAEANRAVERGTEATREAVSASADALGQYNAKVMEIVRSNFASTAALFAALVQAKSVPEAMSLNADHLRRQMEELTSQGRELATLAQRIALDAMQPFKGAADR